MGASDPWAFGWTQVFTIVGLAITIGIAIGGFRTFGRWKREKLEERRIEVALDFLGVAYEAKYIFANIRGAMSYEYEWQDMPVDDAQTAAQRSNRGQFYATLKRIERNKDFFDKVWQLQPRCMAVF